MHIKSNIEHNVIDVVILAICPLILIMDNASSALYYICNCILFCNFSNHLFDA